MNIKEVALICLAISVLISREHNLPGLKPTTNAKFLMSIMYKSYNLYSV